MANPDFVDFGTEQDSTGAITVNSPGSWNANDIFILYVATDGFTPTLSTPNGFVLAQDPSGNNASVNVSLGVCGMHFFWKRAAGNKAANIDPMPVIAAPSGGGTVQACHTNVYNNCRTTGTPFHKIVTATVGTASSAITTPGVTTTLAGCTVLGVAASENDDQKFDSWGFTGSATPGGTIDSGWHSALGNACAWAGGRGGFAAAGGPRTGTSTFAATTRQAQIGFALASLAETLATGTEAVTSRGSTLSATGTVAASASETVTAGASTVSATGVTLAALAGNEAVTSTGSTLSASGIVTSGPVGSFTLTSGSSKVASTAVSTMTGTEAISSSASVVAATGGVSIVGSAAITSSASTAAHTAIHAAPLSMGAVGIRQKANATATGFPGTGPCSTLASITAWATSTAYALDSGIRRSANGNVYDLTQGGTSASSGTGPSGTGTGIVDNTCRWSFVAADPGSNDAAAGDLILVSGARGEWATPGTPGYDNNSNTFTEVARNSYNPPFPQSQQALYAATNATGKTGIVGSLDYGAPSGQSDECTTVLVVNKGGTFIKQIVYNEPSAPTANVVTGLSVRVTGPAMIYCFAWLDGVVRTPGTSHKAVFGGGFSNVPLGSALVSLTNNGYIQHALGVLDATAPGMYPATYTPTVTTDSGESSAIRTIVIQQADGFEGSSVLTSRNSTVVATGTVVTPIAGVFNLTSGASTLSAQAGALASGSEAVTSSGSRLAATAGAIATGTESSQSSGSTIVSSGITGTSGNESVSSSGSSVTATAGTVATGTESTTSSGSQIAAIAGILAAGSETISSTGSQVAGVAGALATGAGSTRSGDSTLASIGSVTAAGTALGNVSITTARSTVASAGVTFVAGTASTLSGGSSVVLSGAVTGGITTASANVSSTGSSVAGVAGALVTGVGSVTSGRSMVVSFATSLISIGNAVFASQDSQVVGLGTVTDTALGNAFVLQGDSRVVASGVISTHVNLPVVPTGNAHYIAQGDTEPGMYLECLNEGRPDSLGDVIAWRMRWKRPDGMVLEVPVQPVDLSKGAFVRFWEAGDTDLPGVHTGQLVLTRASGGEQCFPNDATYFYWTVTAQDPAPGE